MIAFGAFSLDEDAQRLTYGERVIPLRAKALAVLRELVRRRGRVATKEELFAACWPNTAVTQTVLRVCVAEIRAALAADVTGSTSIENVGRRGYRLVADAADGSPRSVAPIGRERELAVLRRALGRAESGQRQMVFVAGEAGLGKTTLLEQFVEEARTTGRIRVGWGQCVEVISGTEPHLPFLDLLARLCADDPGGVIVATLERYAPSWLVQLPSLFDATRAKALERRIALTTNRERLLREIAEALEAAAQDKTLVLVLEDLHWSDLSSGDVLAYLAQRSTPAHLLVVGSYRHAEFASGDGSLRTIKQGLVANRGAIEIQLAPLTLTDVEGYLSRRLTGSPIDASLGRSVHTRTKGNPLFMTATVDYLLDQNALNTSRGRWQLAKPLEGMVPDGLRQLALRQLDRLAPTDRRVLDAACIAGAEFTVASAAAANGVGASDIEEACMRLASHNELVSASGVAAWPDGTVSGRYEFRHVLYREMLEEALPLARRQLFHLAVGERLETAWGQQATDIAAELAIHFEAGGDEERAIRYHIAAGKRARSRFADREAVGHLRSALEHLDRQPVTPQRLARELSCVLDLGAALTGVRGPASQEVLEAFNLALDLANKLNVPQASFGAQTSIYTCFAMRAELDRARKEAEALLAASAQFQNPFFTTVGHVSLGYTLFNLGEFTAAQRHFMEAHALWRPDLSKFGFDPSILARAMLGFHALIAGNPAEGADWVRNSVAYAEAQDNPFNVSFAYQTAAQYYATAGQRELALDLATKANAAATEYGYVTHAIVAAIIGGWARRDVEAIRQGIARYESAEQYAATSFYRALLIETLIEVNDLASLPAELTTALAFVERSGERRHLAELHRLRGECFRRGACDANGTSHAQARACFGTALATAREQGARLWELRAAISLADLLAADGEPRTARELVAGCVGSFTRGGDLPDLHRAHTLLAKL